MIATAVHSPCLDLPPVTLEEGVEGWRQLLGPHSGVIRELMELKSDPAETQLFVYAARTGPSLQHVGARSPSATGSGASPDKRAAMHAAVGEAIERYCPLFAVHPEPVLETSFAEIDCDAITPGELSLFDAEQYASDRFSYVPFTEHTKVAWVEMTRAANGTRVRVPAQCVYLRYQHRENVAVVSPYVSTGLACGVSPERAFLKGLYEVVERDAINIAWLSRLSLPSLDVSGVDNVRLRTILDLTTRAHLVPYFTLLTLDIDIPIVLCAMVDESGRRAACAVGAAADLNPVLAAAKAAEEAAHTRIWLTGSLNRASKTFTASFNEVRDFSDHVLLYGSAEMARRADFFWRGGRRQDLRTVTDQSSHSTAEDIATCVRTVQAAGLEVLYKDLTTPDVRSCGLSVVRTVVPGLQNINGPHRYRLLGGRRLYDVPVKLGLLPSPLDRSALNTDPHPFP